ncbi:MAG: neutral zinc metallopeptidase [Saprospiraceae bacterium]|nr:neutral zinc metallopeptidase [Saprospiraceae bacterium]MBK6567025.1 neutral zinc metallopeptidase [Saprospiraceae bacterium]MBK8079843.1 neutral zinc metallopeptidase [Saprospiraceae bacterium]MBK8372480.1 neutral zinc metallopeptidase [Saprospiraceae bacterium]MBK8547963.1 neutral zinc metallopeptidase [Saprospiraceae bacterium]
MKLGDYRKSENFEDKRGMSTTGKVAIGGGAIGVIFLIIQLFLGGDSQQIAQALQEQLNQPASGQVQELTPEEKALGDFVSKVLAGTEDVWSKVFQKHGSTYREPKLILYSNAIQSGCGGASSNSGPFYCPADETVYMDLSFFQTLKERFGAKGGDFAIAYVIAHEVGHHVQKLQGVLQQVQQLRQSGSQEGKQAYIALELQADFYAGVFAHHMQDYLSEGDIEEALSAAASVGDDNIQKKTQGYVVEESFTHGTSEQRAYWLARGIKTGDIAQGNTFEEVQ